METKLIKIGNSFGIRIPKSLIQQYDLSKNEIEIDPIENGILIKSKKKARAGWKEQIVAAIKNDDTPDNVELLGGFDDDFTDKEWHW